MISADFKITIVGLGLLGGSYASGLAKKGYKVKAIDINQEYLEHALANKWIVEGSDDPSLVSDADLVIFCLYPNTLVKWLNSYQNLLKPNALLTDVTGVKRSIMSKINGFLRTDVKFIYSHPMAGKEVSGALYSDSNIFKSANFIVIKDEDIQAMQTIKDLATILEFKNIVELDAKSHDEMIAFVSQLTHVIAVCLMNVSDNTHLKDYTGDSFRDLTRIAKINENLWYELFMQNKDMLLKEIDAFTRQLDHFKEVIINDDEEEMKRLFRQSSMRRKEFDKK
ncbi:MAG: prephenate dehydrogenase [Erysipelotrichaceae bacterium]|nr:prephenate dehydrogenase [Erysipelotrichaceae bacterium]MDY5997529.1 prephenate dehydrogenase [Erysipelotrichaceae bacterium]